MVSCYMISKSQKEYFRFLFAPDDYEELEKEEFFLFGAVEEDLPVGAAILQMMPARAEISVLAVADPERFFEIGEKLLRQCVLALEKTEIRSLSAVTQEDSDEEKLFRDFGMEKTAEESAIYYMTLFEVMGHPFFSKRPKKSSTPFGEVPKHLLMEFFQKSLPASPISGFLGNPDDTLSRAFLEDEKVHAVMTVEKDETGLLLTWIASDKNDPEVLRCMFSDAIAEAKKRYPPEIVFYFGVYEEHSARTAEKLFPNCSTKTKESLFVLPTYRFRIIAAASASGYTEQI